MILPLSKKLEHDDQSGFEFSKELLGEDYTAAINFDRLQKHPQLGYIIIEYWHKNASKFLSLWRAKLDFNATLYLVNYAKKGTKWENEVLLIEVLDVDETGIVREKKTEYTREKFAEWFKKLNRECLSEKRELMKDIYSHKSTEDIGKIILQIGKYKGETVESVYIKDVGYLEWLKEKECPCAGAVRCYLDRLNRR